MDAGHIKYKRKTCRNGDTLNTCKLRRGQVVGIGVMIASYDNGTFNYKDVSCTLCWKAHKKISDGSVKQNVILCSILIAMATLRKLSTL